MSPTIGVNHLDCLQMRENINLLSIFNGLQFQTMEQIRTFYFIHFMGHKNSGDWSWPAKAEGSP